MKTIIIDPGHGGTDSGAAAFGYLEKQINLIVAKRVAELLKEYNPALTRTTDITLSLSSRAALVKDKYKYCLSIHFNARGGQGIETIHSVYSESGKQLAETIANKLNDKTGLPVRRVFSRKSSRGEDYYAMHRNTGSTTTVIVESLFLDSESDIQALNVEKISQAIADGFKTYMIAQGPEGVREKSYKKVSITGRTDYDIVKRGSKGQDVVTLQEQLREMYYYTGSIDGDFGPKTEDAVRWLQRVNNLVVDGIVGPVTWENVLCAHVYEVNPMDLKNEIIKEVGTKIKGDFINSTFFDMSTMTSLGNIVNNGKLLAKQKLYEDGKQHDWVKRGNLIVYYDGTVAVKMIMDIEKEEDLNNIKFAVSGFNMEPLNLKAEWWPDSIGRTTWRSMLGYNPINGKVYAVIMANCSAARGRKMLEKLGCKLKLGLDSGDSTNGRFDGNTVRTTSRQLYGIIRFE